MGTTFSGWDTAKILKELDKQLGALNYELQPDLLLLQQGSVPETTRDRSYTIVPGEYRTKIQGTCVTVEEAFQLHVWWRAKRRDPQDALRSEIVQERDAIHDMLADLPFAKGGPRINVATAGSGSYLVFLFTFTAEYTRARSTGG